MNPYNNKYLHDLEQGTKAINDKVFKIWLHVKPFFRLSSTYDRYEKKVTNGIFAVAGEVLKEKRGKLPKGKPKLFTDHLLSAEHLQEDKIVDEIITLIGAVSI